MTLRLAIDSMAGDRATGTIIDGSLPAALRRKPRASIRVAAGAVARGRAAALFSVEMDIAAAVPQS